MTARLCCAVVTVAGASTICCHPRGHRSPHQSLTHDVTWSVDPAPSGPDSSKLARGRELDRYAVNKILWWDLENPPPPPEPATIPVGCPYPLFES